MKRNSVIKAVLFAIWSYCLSVHADIVWSGDINLQLDYTSYIVTPDDPLPQPGIAEFDFNNDGTIDLLLNHSRGMELTPLNGCALVNHGESLAQEDFWGNYDLGITIDSSLAWGTDEALLVKYSHSDAYGDSYIGPWIVHRQGTLGFSFEENGQTHYGWLRMSNQYGSSVLVHDFAYESLPNEGIVAGAIPEPSSVGLLAIGAMGIWTLRKRKNR